MKKTKLIVELAVVIIILLYWSQQAAAGGTLSFLTLYPSSSVYGDDSESNEIYISGGFGFGTGTVYGAYVSTNGYISMGERVSTSSPEIPGTRPIVAPYAADIDPRIAGTVRYTQFTTTDYSQMSRVSSFIRDQTYNSFYGTRMMVAEWDGVAEYSGSYSITSTFQCVLITDGSASYAVFIYECGGMQWDGASIGWQATSSLYQQHPLSGYNSDDVGCEYSSSYSAIVYRLDSDSRCEYDEFECDNGNCISQSYVCNDFNSCGDNSDEQNCGYSTCDSDEFECDNGNCIPQRFVCNDFNSCGDNSDEQNCGYDYDCYYNDFDCDNGDCVPSSYECDGDNDCGDNSDEEDCYSTNVGLAVGLSVGFFILFFIGVPSFICILVFCLIHKQKRRRTVQTRIVTTTPSAGATTVVTSSQDTSFTAPAPVAAPYPTQQPVYKDAKFSNQDAPPSYDVATAFPQGHLHGQPNPMAAYPPQQNVPYPVQTQAAYPGYPPAAPMAYPPQT